MRKHLLFLFALALGLTACNKNDNFKVNVSLKNGNDQTVYLQKYVDNAPVIIDSAVIANEMAVLTAPKDDPQVLYSLKVKGKRGSMPFFSDNKDVSIVGDINNAKDVEIKTALFYFHLAGFHFIQTQKNPHQPVHPLRLIRNGIAVTDAAFLILAEAVPQPLRIALHQGNRGL